MKIYNWLFKTKDGEIIIGQKPNAAIIIAAAGYLAAFITSGDLENWFSFIGRTALIYWGLLEIFKGVNNYRKLLGIVVVGLILIGLVAR